MIDFGTFLNELWQELGQDISLLKNIGTVCEYTSKLMYTFPLLGVAFAISIIKRK